MSAPALALPLLSKEARALAPIWLAVVAAMWISVEVNLGPLRPLVFAAGAAALGAWAVGHEFAHRTLALLLTQPVSRSTLLYGKALVLGTMLALLTGAAVVSGGLRLLSGDWWLAAIVFTPLLGFCVAPALTLACRSAMAGLVFTLAIPAVLWTTGQVVRAVRAGFDVPLFEYEPALALMVGGLTAASAAGLVWGRARFLRLQTLDAPIGLPSAPRRWRAASAAHASARPAAGAWTSPLAALVRKELRLHPMALVIAGLFSVKWIALSLAGAALAFAGQSFEMLAWLYCGLIALIVGASASAEEGALGTRDWQLLQPYAYWKQWLVKAGVVLVLSLALGVGLAGVLEAAFPLIGDSGSQGSRLLPGFALPSEVNRFVFVMGGLAVLGLYSSTLCSGSARALLAALLVSFVWSYAYTRAFMTAASLDIALFEPLFGEGVWSPVWWRNVPGASDADYRWAAASPVWGGTALVAGFLALALLLAARNHRFAPGRGAVLRQLLLLTLYVAGGSVLVRVLPTLTLWIRVTW